MNTAIRLNTRPSKIWLLALVILLGGWFMAPAETVEGIDTAEVLTNVAQVRAVAPEQSALLRAVRLQGVVLSIEDNQLILQDDTGGMLVTMNLGGQPTVREGDEVRITGDAQISRGGEISQTLIDDDGVHAMVEKSATTRLAAGLYPFRLEWFNGQGDYGLGLDYQGPEMARGPIPDDVFFREAGGKAEHLEPGLNYTGYEGTWWNLPNFAALSPVTRGMVSNLTVQVHPRVDNVGLVFTGFFRANKTGDYTFWLRSDDGSRLQLGEPLRLEKLGTAGLPPPRQFTPTQLTSEKLELERVQVTGLVTRVKEGYAGVDVNLTFGAEQIHLKAPAGGYGALSKLVNSRIRATGIYQNAYDADGQVVPTVVIPKLADISIVEMDAIHWGDYPLMTLKTLSATNIAENANALVRVRGTVERIASADQLILETNGVNVLIETNGVSAKVGQLVEALGWWERDGSNSILRGSIARVLTKDGGAEASELPLLTQIIQVKSLSRTEAQRGYPVQIQGIVTAVIEDNFVVQDATWSIYCYGNRLNTDELPKVGEVWKIEGKSDVQFAPDIIADRATYVGPGILPEPIRPTKDELINGSLDTQYIELEGIVTETGSNAVSLLTREGELTFKGILAPNLNEMKDARVRIRGVFIPDRDTNEMLLPTLSPIGLFNASINVDEAPPVDSFDLPLKHISDLLHFDAQADVLRRVKISGQILIGYQGQYFLTDGTTGARFELREPMKLEPGDLVQVVGFPDVSGPSPILHEAYARVSVRATLPEPMRLSESTVLNNKLDAMLVSLQSRLVSVNQSRAETVLELQIGTRGYLARLANQNGSLPYMEPGSLLKLTGVYDAQGNGEAAADVSSFELLLASPTDVTVLERPSWWTVRHTLIVVGAMLFIILAAMIWITVLHRQVEERSRQLAAEIKNREQVEYQRALEAERTRIAQDLHDELGATLTEIRFLGAVKSRDESELEDMRSHLKEVSDKSHQMVSSLDEIVWAVNPANDSLPNLANYLCHLAEEFFRTTEMRCRLDVDEVLPPIALTSEVRHSLYLVVREGLNNVAKHSQATEAWLRIHYRDKALHVTIEDNGRGFARAEAGNGLSNMESRLKKIGGNFTCESQPGQGTVCRLYLPLV